MLNLLPVRLLLTVITCLVAIILVLCFYAGALGVEGAVTDAFRAIRWTSYGTLFLMVAPWALWRWTPIFQEATFPYLGGQWKGELVYESVNGKRTKQVTLDVRHTLINVQLLLESDESSSRTLIVQAVRDAGINRDRLFYVYLNERKEGVPGGGQTYRGLAILRLERIQAVALVGDYFTETNSKGTLRLARESTNPWWVLWK